MKKIQRLISMRSWHNILIALDYALADDPILARNDVYILYGNNFTYGPSYVNFFNSYYQDL